MQPLSISEFLLSGMVAPTTSWRSARHVHSVLLISAMLTSLHGEETTGKTPVEEFKSFVSNPPAIERMVFRVQRRSPDETAGVETSLDSSMNSTLFKAVWQTNAVLFYNAENENDPPQFTAGRAIVSVFKDEQWLLKEGKEISTCSTPVTGPNGNNPVARSVTFALFDLYRVLQAGVMHVGPGQIKWIGNRFFIQGTIDSVNVRRDIEGTLIDENGRASELVVSYSRVA